MTVFNNPNFISFDGSPITGRTPTKTIIMADEGFEMSPQLRGAVAHAYKTFCDAVNVSAFPNGYHLQNRNFPDGSKVRMESNNGVHQVMVWPVSSGSEQSMLHGIGLCITDIDGSLFDAYTFVVDGTPKPQPVVIYPGLDSDNKKLSNGQWHVKRVNRLHGGNKLWVSADRNTWLSALCFQPFVDPCPINTNYRLASYKTQPKAAAYSVLSAWNTFSDSRVNTYSDIDWPGLVMGRFGRYLFQGNDTRRLMRSVNNTPHFSVFKTPDNGECIFTLEFPSSSQINVYRQSARPKYRLWNSTASGAADATIELVQSFSAPSGKYFYTNGVSMSESGDKALITVLPSYPDVGAFAEITLGDVVSIAYISAGDPINVNGSNVYLSISDAVTTSTTETPASSAKAEFVGCDNIIHEYDVAPQLYYNSGLSGASGTFSASESSFIYQRIPEQWNRTHSISAPTRELSYTFINKIPERAYYDGNGNKCVDHYFHNIYYTSTSALNFALNYTSHNDPLAIGGFAYSGSQGSDISDVWDVEDRQGYIFANGRVFYLYRASTYLTDTISYDITSTIVSGVSTFLSLQLGALTGSFVQENRSILFYDHNFDFMVYTEEIVTDNSVSGSINNSAGPSSSISITNQDFTSLAAPVVTYRLVASFGYSEVFSFDIACSQPTSASFDSSKRPFSAGGFSIEAPWGTNKGGLEIFPSVVTPPVYSIVPSGISYSHSTPSASASFSTMQQGICPPGSPAGIDGFAASADGTLSYNNGNTSGSASYSGTTSFAGASAYGSPYTIGSYSTAFRIKEYCDVRFARDPKTLALVVNVVLSGHPVHADNSWFFVVDNTGVKTLHDILELPSGSKPILWQQATQFSLVSI